MANLSTDKTLVKIVHRETVHGLELVATLTRFGDLAVFLHSAEGECLWQGANVLEARELARSRAAAAARAAR